jgi:hypothetical protein
MQKHHVQWRHSLETILNQQDLTKQLLNMFNHVHTINNNNNNQWPITKQLLNTVHFYCYKAPSTVKGAGHGVFLRSIQNVKRGSIVSLYPGVVYQAYEPKFFQSIGNSFILQRKDFTFIDGNDRYLSKFMYTSCSKRDAILMKNEDGSLKRIDVCDDTWLRFKKHTCEQDMDTISVHNPYNIGHYINSPMNNNNIDEANVMYYEYDFRVGVSENSECSDFVWPLELQYLIPNIPYQPSGNNVVQSIVLVALRDIQNGEELFASYDNLVHAK